MLVLSRKEGERIRIGDNIVITIVRTGGDKVRVGIEAPADMIVLRDELKTIKQMSSVESDSVDDSGLMPLNMLLSAHTV